MTGNSCHVKNAGDKGQQGSANAVPCVQDSPEATERCAPHKLQRSQIHQWQDKLAYELELNDSWHIT